MQLASAPPCSRAHCLPKGYLAAPLQVLSHWACSKISAAADMADQQLHDVITARLKSYSGVRYSLVAAHAEGVGRRSLAAMLLENESCAADQVR